MRKLSVLLGIAAVVTATTSWKDGVPRYASKKGRPHIAPGKQHRRLHQSRKAIVSQTSPLRERARQPSKHSATTVSRYHRAAAASSSGIAPPLLPAEELETLKALYHSLSGPDWHIKDDWMSASNPCGNGTINTTRYGVECATFAAAPSNKSSSHVTGLVLPQNSLVGKLPPFSSLQHLLHLDFSNSDLSEVSNDFGNVVSGTLVTLCGLGNLSTILLASNNFTGSIPECLQSLANATVLDLNFNSIQGTTPDELCLLRNLEELHLRGNRLEGTVPECIGEELTALRVLDYSNFNADVSIGKQLLSGTLPASLCDLEHLETMQFQATQGLDGTLPDCLGAKQPQLKILAVETNQLYGSIPEELCQASALEQVVLNHNALTGILPSCLGSLSRLTGLALKTNQFHGPIPEKLCEASALKYVLLWDNALTGSIPGCLGRLSQLTDLELNQNKFNGSIPEELCQASALEDLVLTNNALTGTIPSCLGSLSQLTWLTLSINHFHGPIPEELCQVSALKYLFLYENTLTGTLPSCLGNFRQLVRLELNQNYFHGPIPEELCEASALKDLVLSENALSGALPSCLAMSFPVLLSMLLHNNALTGALPSKWALPSLISIMPSNNPKLSGSLPSSLFLQHATSNVSKSSSSNLVLRAVVIEGTSIGGTLPAALCSAPRLENLAFSGNELTGSLPGCISSLQNLQTLRISNNHLTGTLPVAINNMTSLTVLDLSTNEIQGRVPAALGDISPNLDTVQLHFNRLSCDLPPSVLAWQGSNASISFNLLDGNLFGCGSSTFFEIFALSIQGAAGLRNGNEQAFDAYSCGSSVYVLPVTTITILAVPVVFGVIFMAVRGRLALQWRIALERMVNPSMLINALDQAEYEIRGLAFGVMAAAILAGSVALGLSMNVAKSAFDCEYMAAPTLANKGGSNARSLSIGVGAAVSVGLVLGLFLWWRRLVTKCSSSSHDHGGIVAVNNKPLYTLEENAEAWGFDAERTAEAAPQQPVSSYYEGSVRALKLMALILVLVIFTIGPNVCYVLVFLSHLSQQQKVVSEMAVVLAKTAIGTLLVPKVARKAVDLIILHGALTFVRFRLRMIIATALSSFTLVVLPVSIVLVTEPRCLYYIFEPQVSVSTDVQNSYCSVTDSKSDICSEYVATTYSSTYTPGFAYDGEVCVSAVLSVYGPVFVGVVLLIATLPAGMEFFVVPWLAPWCFSNAESSTMARTGLAFFRAVTWNVWPTLADASVLPPNFSLGAAKLDFLAQRVVERAFVQLIATLIIALTFGIAVPVVGGACAVAAFVQLLHHRHVLGQVVGLGRLEQPAVVPNLMGCTEIPACSAVVIVVTVLLVWVCGIVGYLEPAVIGCMLLIGLCVAFAACGIAVWWQKSRSEAPRGQNHVRCTGSSDVSEGMQIESIFGGPEIRPVAEKF